MNSKKLAAVGLAVTLSVSAAACGSTEEPEEAGAVAVEVQTPRTGELMVDTAYIGTVAPQEQVYVIPKTSGTVTETFFEVGDTVQEGDVLFKIDDEAAQLQMASARATYESAQAGVTAQNGGARDLQNYQTEEQIRQLKDSLWKTDDQIDEMEDSLGDLRDAGGALAAAKDQAQARVEQAVAAYAAKEGELGPQIAQKQEELKAAQETVAGLQQQIGSADETQKEILQAQLTEAESSVNSISGELEKLSGELAGSKALKDQAQAGLDQINSQLTSIDASKTQLKSGIDQIENSQDTIRDNLNMAEQAYAITQNEIYPQTDAASSAQLGSAAIAIDSAQMQLDFCTVTSPISGIVESVSVEKNGMAAAGNPAYIISNKESMTVTFHVAEKAKNVLSTGDHVTVEREGTEYDGVITEIGTMANPQTKLFQVKATVAGAGASLPNGVSVKVYATTEKDAGKLIIPYDSIYFSAGDAYVYCVENGQIVKTDVTVGLMSDTEAVIEEGLTADSQVVSNWSSKLRNGVEAQIVSRNGEAVDSEPLSDGDGASQEPSEEDSAGETDQGASGDENGEEDVSGTGTEMTEEAE